MSGASAYFLVVHGSRDRRSQGVASQLCELVSRRWLVRWQRQEPAIVGAECGTAVLSKPPSLLLEMGALELGSQPLHQSLASFGDHAWARGIKRVQVLPLLLLPGVHVAEDIPAEVFLAQRALGNRVQLQLCPFVGSIPAIIELFAKQFRYLSGQRILLAHGSRRPGSQQFLTRVARSLNAELACWSVAPSLAQQVAACVRPGGQELAIVPYFLFPGGILEAIAQEVNRLQRDFPQITLQLGEPLGATPELAQVIIDLLEEVSRD